jgi:hypothetical protein
MRSNLPPVQVSGERIPHKSLDAVHCVREELVDISVMIKVVEQILAVAETERRGPGADAGFQLLNPGPAHGLRVVHQDHGAGILWIVSAKLLGEFVVPKDQGRCFLEDPKCRQHSHEAADGVRVRGDAGGKLRCAQTLGAQHGGNVQLRNNEEGPRLPEGRADLDEPKRRRRNLVGKGLQTSVELHCLAETANCAGIFLEGHFSLSP